MQAATSRTARSSGGSPSRRARTALRTSPGVRIAASPPGTFQVPSGRRTIAGSWPPPRRPVSAGWSEPADPGMVTAADKRAERRTSDSVQRAGPRGRELEYVAEAAAAGHTASSGPFSARCTDLLAWVHGAPDALLTTSCTDALEMTALLLDLGPGDTVIVPSFAPTSTALAFARQGVTVRFADIEPATLGIDPASVARLLDDSVRAVVCVHYGGLPCDIDGLLELVELRPKVTLVEDNAHGFFGTHHGRSLGTFGRFSHAQLPRVEELPVRRGRCTGRQPRGRRRPGTCPPGQGDEPPRAAPRPTRRCTLDRHRVVVRDGRAARRIPVRAARAVPHGAHRARPHRGALSGAAHAARRALRLLAARRSGGVHERAPHDPAAPARPGDPRRAAVRPRLLAASSRWRTTSRCTRRRPAADSPTPSPAARSPTTSAAASYGCPTTPR